MSIDNTRVASETTFLAAWRQAVKLAGPQWFGDGADTDADSADIWGLAPRVLDIEERLGMLSHGEGVFLATLVGFYNSWTGGDMWKLVEVRALADVAAILDGPRRAAIAALLISYAGW